ncbi:MAG: hypothetical protein IJ963_04005 [Phascolarctobacterium sp.]|nr:hypothetical protein [Phascolarctobacterium sp.]MBR2140009.1 hypothetical protein [Phascolarctobacterium sp.]
MVKQSTFRKNTYLIKKKSAPQPVVDALDDFLRSKFASYSFETQEELVSDLKQFLINNNQSVYVGITQPNISRALKILMKHSYLKGNQIYTLVKSPKKYHFVRMDAGLIPLFKFVNAKEDKDSLHILSENTLVFCIPKDKHEAFIATLEEHFPTDTLWDYSSLEKHLMLMFNTATPEQEANCKLFKRFFEIKKEYESKGSKVLK